MRIPSRFEAVILYRVAQNCHTFQNVFTRVSYRRVCRTQDIRDLLPMYADCMSFANSESQFCSVFFFLLLSTKKLELRSVSYIR